MLALEMNRKTVWESSQDEEGRVLLTIISLLQSCLVKKLHLVYFPDFHYMYSGAVQLQFIAPCVFSQPFPLVPSL